MTYPITDGFLNLSLSGNVAGNSLKMTASSDIGLPSNDLRGPFDELLPANGLLQYIERAEPFYGGFHHRIGKCGDHQNRNGRFLAPQLDQQIDSCLSRHPVIADDEVEAVRSERLERPVHALCRLDRVALPFQHFLDRVPAGLVVVCDEDAAH